jgi:hypothetical protein
MKDMSGTNILIIILYDIRDTNSNFGNIHWPLLSDQSKKPTKYWDS